MVEQTLGARTGSPTTSAKRELLLLLDNFEHVIAAAPSSGRCSGGCPNLRLIVTTREVLRLRGEVEYAVLAAGRERGGRALLRALPHRPVDDERRRALPKAGQPAAGGRARSRADDACSHPPRSRPALRNVSISSRAARERMRGSTRCARRSSGRHDLSSAERAAPLRATRGLQRRLDARGGRRGRRGRCRDARSRSSTRASSATRMSASGCSRRSVSSPPSGSRGRRGGRHCTGGMSELPARAGRPGGACGRGSARREPGGSPSRARQHPGRARVVARSSEPRARAAAGRRVRALSGSSSTPIEGLRWLQPLLEPKPAGSRSSCAPTRCARSAAPRTPAGRERCRRRRPIRESLEAFRALGDEAQAVGSAPTASAMRRSTAATSRRAGRLGRAGSRRLPHRREPKR